MHELISAYREVAPGVYRETAGLYYEDFVVGDTFEHRPGRTITDTDNIWMTLLTMNTQPVHFDARYAAATEWQKMLVDSTLTIAMLTGMSVRTVSAKVVANLGWDNVRACHPVSQATRFTPAPPCSPNASRKVVRAKALCRFKPKGPTRTESS
ncbi:MaoC family dehydratase [Mycobacterium marinum]|nr:MaoC/PaaZ C-terminal domain-containing protein [Mycobacterium marinum]WCS17165.1 MaoC family dehydratase [Mycobacterium marinum]